MRNQGIPQRLLCWPSFIATLPGVVGSSVQVRASASIASMSVATSVVQASLNKTISYARKQIKSGGGVSAQWSKGNLVLPPQINSNIVCDVTIESQFTGPDTSANLARTLYDTGGPCNKIFNNMCGSFYQLERTTACISEPSGVPIQYASCEYLSGAVNPTPSPAPPSANPQTPHPTHISSSRLTPSAPPPWLTCCNAPSA